MSEVYLTIKGESIISDLQPARQRPQGGQNQTFSHRAAAIFWLKTRARWKEVSVHEHVASQEPIAISDTARFVEWMIESSESVASKGRAARE